MDVNSFKLLRYYHLDTLFDKKDFGVRLIFEHNLFRWQREHNCFEEPFSTCLKPSVREESSVIIEKKNYEKKHTVSYFFFVICKDF